MFRKRTHSQNYYSNQGNELRSRRALNNKFQIAKKMILKLSAAFLIGGVIYLIFFSPFLTVKKMIAEGNKTISGIEMEKIVLSVAGQKKWKIFSNNILLIDLTEMENAVKKRFNNIDTIKIEKKFPQTIKVIIKEKSADIAWCNKIIVEKISNNKNISSDEVLPNEIPQCYLSDEEGVIYEKIGGNVSVDSIKIFRNEPIKIGAKISDENLKNFIRKIFYDFEPKTGLSLAYLYMLPPASRELHLVTNKNMKIYFDLNRGADEQISDLREFLKSYLKENNGKSASYDYIDLRIFDRIYYKAENRD